MARTERANPSAQKPAKNANTAAARRSQVSRSLTKLLRHQAENEKIHISPAGWIKLDDLLTWKGLDRIAKGITLSEIFEVVEEDGRTGKGRFGVRYIKDLNVKDVDSAVAETSGKSIEGQEGSTEVDGIATGAMVAEASNTSAEDPQAGSDKPHSLTNIDPGSKNTPETQAALHHHLTNPDSPPEHYLIRATQGHSMKAVESADLLTPITLSEPSKIPNTVVHGTFYGAWDLILATGGLKAMGRNNVHFATGPSLEVVLALIGDSNKAMTKKGQVDEVLSRNKVISGMRWDAQLLIYIDLKACLDDVASRGLDMTWWMSGNGVVLTEGVSLSEEEIIPQQQDQASTQSQQLIVDDLPENDVPVIASKSAKSRRAQENTQAAAAAAEQPQQLEPSTTIPEDTSQPIIASKSVKARKAQENTAASAAAAAAPDLDTKQPETESNNPNFPTDSDTNIPIIASKHAKARFAREQQVAQQEASEAPITASKSVETQFARNQQQRPKIVPTRYWLAVVEIKHGLGVIWRRGEGVVQELPEQLRSMPLPRGKGRGHGADRGRGRGGGKRGGRGSGSGKPRVNVEAGDQVVDVDVDDGDGRSVEE